MRIEATARFRAVFPVLGAVLLAIGLCNFAHANSHARPSAKGQSGELQVFALLTTDRDYWEKWATPPETVPAFNTPTSVRPHEKIRLLILISGLTVKDGKINAICQANAGPVSKKILQQGPRKKCFTNNEAPSVRHSYSMASYSLVLSGRGDTPYLMEVNVDVADRHSKSTVKLRLSVEVSED